VAEAKVRLRSHAHRRQHRPAAAAAAATTATTADARPVLLPPINFIFKLLQSRATISVWLYENLGLRIEGKLRVRLRPLLTIGLLFADCPIGLR